MTGLRAKESGSDTDCDSETRIGSGGVAWTGQKKTHAPLPSTCRWLMMLVGAVGRP